MLFIEYVRENIASYGKDNLEEALKDAMDKAIANNILKDFLIERRSEVMKVMVLDYTYERRMELMKQDYFEDGRLAQLIELVKDGLLKITDAANKANMPVEEFELLLK